jgi:minor curlin subunit
MFKKTFTAAALVLATASTALPVAAQQISFGISAGNQQERDAIAGALVLYQIANGGDPVEVLTQASQGGSVGVIHQEGNGHNGSLAQGGGGNAGGVFQFGENTNAHLGQTGGQGDLVFVFGW